MSTADPFLPVPDPDAQDESDVLPDDDDELELELERADDDASTAPGEDRTEDIARPALFRTPEVADGLDIEELERDLEGE